MHYVTAALNVVSDRDFDEILQVFKTMEEETNKEPGCIKFHAYPLSREDRKIMLWEIWEDKAALGEHFEMPHTKAALAQNLTVVEWMLTSDV